PTTARDDKNRFSPDQPLGQLIGLDREEPVEGRRCDLLIDVGESRDSRNGVEQRATRCQQT
ncbi:MAG: hypothetical protein ACREON_05610, partial [Gemmatimonadaceae bacterium]